MLDRLVALDIVLTQQVLGEFLNVARRRFPGREAEVAGVVDTWLGYCSLLPTTPSLMLPAYALANRYALQYWDSLILSVCSDNGVTALLSEDLQDGQQINGVTIINPFTKAGQAMLDRFLEGHGR